MNDKMTYFNFACFIKSPALSWLYPAYLTNFGNEFILNDYHKNRIFW